MQGKEAKQIASQGQKRSLVTALRLAEWNLFLQTEKRAPILSIDDFGVHLDKERSSQLLKEIDGCGQLFLTSPYPLPPFQRDS